MDISVAVRSFQQPPVNFQVRRLTQPEKEHLRVYTQRRICESEKRQYGYHGLMGALPVVVSSVVGRQPADSVLDNAIHDRDQSPVCGVVQDGL